MNTTISQHRILTDISPDGMEELRRIEQIGRTCYKSVNMDGNEERTKAFVRLLIQNGHESVLEHGAISVDIITDRGVTHELVRHRLASYTQESTRYCNYSKGKFGGECTFVLPHGMDIKSPSYALWRSACSNAEMFYFDLLKAGEPPEIARAVLPNSLKAEIVVTANYREWRHIFKLRTSKAAHPEIRFLMTGILNDLKRAIPVIFDDIEEGE